MKRKTFDSTDYRKAMNAFDGIHCLNCGSELPPQASRKDHARKGTVLSKCCDKACSVKFLQKTLKNWAELRRSVAERDSYTCQDCGYIAPKGFEIVFILPYKVKPGDIESGTVVQIESERGHKSYVKMGRKWDTCAGLDVHHIQPISEGGQEFDESNCVTLCHECHKKRHSTAANAARKHKTLEMFSNENKVLSQI